MGTSLKFKIFLVKDKMPFFSFKVSPYNSNINGLPFTTWNKTLKRCIPFSFIEYLILILQDSPGPNLLFLGSMLKICSFNT